jgi:hypothetical protein
MRAHSEHCSHVVKLTNDVSRLDTMMLCRITFNVTWVCWRIGVHWKGGLQFVVCSCENVKDLNVGRAEYEFKQEDKIGKQTTPFSYQLRLTPIFKSQNLCFEQVSRHGIFDQHKPP